VLQFRANELTKTNQELRLQIQEGKRAEEALRKDAEDMGQLIRSLHECAFFALDVEGRVSSWNAGAERLTGYAAGEITGEPFAWFYGDDEQKKNRSEQNLRVCNQSGRCESEGWRFRRDGSRFWASELITPLRDEVGAGLGFAVVLRDVSAGRNTEAGHRMRERALESLAEGVLISSARNAEHPVLYCNAAWERITGCDRGEIVGNPLGHFFGPNEIDPALVEVRRAIEEHRSITLEAPARRKDGTLFWAQISVSVIHSGRGRPQYLAILLCDLTVQKRREAQIFRRERQDRHPAQCSDTLVVANMADSVSE
jgi:PAS domain S-box-containing protein